MATWKLTERQLEKITRYADSVNRSNAEVKLIPNIRSEALLGISVRFAVPKSWQEDTEENRKAAETVYREIEERSYHRLLPERSDLIQQGVLELKYSSICRDSNEWYVIEPMKFLANDMMKIIADEKRH